MAAVHAIKLSEAARTALDSGQAMGLGTRRTIYEIAKGTGEELARAAFSTCGVRTVAAMADRFDFAPLTGTLYVSHGVTNLPTILSGVEKMIDAEVDKKHAALHAADDQGPEAEAIIAEMSRLSERAQSTAVVAALAAGAAIAHAKRLARASA